MAAVVMAAAAAVVSSGVPAVASTNVTVTLAAGPLSISEPASANLGTATASISGTTISGHLGTTTVTDSRASTAGWTASMSTTSFSDGASPTPHTIAADKLKAYVAAGDGPSLVSGAAVPTTAYVTSATALTLSTSAQTFVTATTTLSNVVSYNPTIVVTLDSSVLAGSYSGTITQSVS